MKSSNPSQHNRQLGEPAIADKRADAMKLAKFLFYQRLMNWPIRESAQCHIWILKYWKVDTTMDWKAATMNYDKGILIYVLLRRQVVKTKSSQNSDTCNKTERLEIRTACCWCCPPPTLLAVLHYALRLIYGCDRMLCE